MLRSLRFYFDLPYYCPRRLKNYVHYFLLGMQKHLKVKNGKVTRQHLARGLFIGVCLITNHEHN